MTLSILAVSTVLASWDHPSVDGYESGSSLSKAFVFLNKDSGNFAVSTASYSVEEIRTSNTTLYKRLYADDVFGRAQGYKYAPEFRRTYFVGRHEFGEYANIIDVSAWMFEWKADETMCDGGFSYYRTWGKFGRLNCQKRKWSSKNFEIK